MIVKFRPFFGIIQIFKTHKFHRSSKSSQLKANQTPNHIAREQVVNSSLLYFTRRFIRRTSTLLPIVCLLAIKRFFSSHFNALSTIELLRLFLCLQKYIITATVTRLKTICSFYGVQIRTMCIASLFFQFSRIDDARAVSGEKSF